MGINHDGRPSSWVENPLPWEAELGDPWSLSWELETAISNRLQNTRRSVLLIGDKVAPIREAVSSALEKRGYYVQSADSKSAIVTALHHTHFDCVVCVCGKRRFNAGNAITQWLRERPEGRYLPLVAVGKGQGFASEVYSLHKGADVYCDYRAIEQELPKLIDSLVLF